jgi:hypothetical protein
MEKNEACRKIIHKFQRWTDICSREFPELKETIEKINRSTGKNRDYTVENSIVFNRDLLQFGEKFVPRYILVADNPGMDEQKSTNMRYLTGKAGQGARNFFLKNGLVEDFEKEVAVLNKTCLHTHSSGDLKKLTEFNDLVENSQYFMADLAVDMHKIFKCRLWIIGCSEFKKKGVFEPFLNRIKHRYSMDADHLKNSVYFYPHFSYGNFQKNINNLRKELPGLTTEQLIEQAGRRGIKI